MKLKLPSFKFNIRQLLLLTLLAGLLVAIVSSSLNQQPMQNYAAICFSQDGKLLAMMGNENTQIYNLDSERMLASIPATGHAIAGRQIVQFKDTETLAFFSEGRRTSGLPSGIYFYSIPDAKISLQIPTTIFDQDVSISAAGVAIRSESTFAVDVHRFDATDFSTPHSKLKARSSDDRIWLSNDGKFVTLFSGFFQSRRPGDPMPTYSSDVVEIGGETLSFGNCTHASAVLSPDNQQVVLSSNYHGVQSIEIESQSERWRYENAYASEEVCFSRDGSTIVFQGVSDPAEPYDSDRYIVAVESETGKERFRIDTQDNMASPYAVSPDGQFVAVATERFTDHGVEVWNVNNKQHIVTLGGGTRSTKIWLYCLLASIWPLAWTWLGKSKPKTVRRPGVLVTTGLAVLWLAGLLLAGYAITFDLILISRFGTFGSAPLLSQCLIVGFSTMGIVTGMVMMVLGLNGLSRHFRRPVKTELA